MNPIRRSGGFQPHPRRVRGVCPLPAAREPQMCSQTGSAPPPAEGVPGVRARFSWSPSAGERPGTRYPRNAPRRAPRSPRPPRNPPPRSPTSPGKRAARARPCPRPRRVPAPVQPLLPAVFIRGRRAEAEASSLAPAAVAAACVVAAAAASRQLAPGKENARELGRPRPSPSRSHESQLRPVRQDRVPHGEGELSG